MTDQPAPPPPSLSSAAGLFKRAPARADSHDSATWLLTFTDLVALLLAFFVMLFAMSKVDLRKWQNLTEALARGLNSVRQEAAIAPHQSLDVAVAELTTGQDLDYLAGILSERLSDDPSFAAGMVRRYTDRLVVTLPAEAVDAEAGTAVEGGTLFQLAGVLRQVRNKIEVVAYAGLDETAGMRVSPWELAMWRALGAAERLRASGYDRSVIVRGRQTEDRRDRVPGGPPVDAESASGRVDLVVRFDAAEEP